MGHLAAGITKIVELQTKRLKVQEKSKKKRRKGGSREK